MGCCVGDPHKVTRYRHSGSRSGEREPTEEQQVYSVFDDTDQRRLEIRVDRGQGVRTETRSVRLMNDQGLCTTWMSTKRGHFDVYDHPDVVREMSRRTNWSHSVEGIPQKVPEEKVRVGSQVVNGRKTRGYRRPRVKIMSWTVGLIEG